MRIVINIKVFKPLGTLDHVEKKYYYKGFIKASEAQCQLKTCTLHNSLKHCTKSKYFIQHRIFRWEDIYIHTHILDKEFVAYLKNQAFRNLPFIKIDLFIDTNSGYVNIY